MNKNIFTCILLMLISCKLYSSERILGSRCLVLGAKTFFSEIDTNIYTCVINSKNELYLYKSDELDLWSDSLLIGKYKDFEVFESTVDSNFNLIVENDLNEKQMVKVDIKSFNVSSRSRILHELFLTEFYRQKSKEVGDSIIVLNKFNDNIINSYIIYNDVEVVLDTIKVDSSISSFDIIDERHFIYASINNSKVDFYIKTFNESNNEDLFLSIDIINNPKYGKSNLKLIDEDKFLFWFKGSENNSYYFLIDLKKVKIVSSGSLDTKLIYVDYVKFLDQILTVEMRRGNCSASLKTESINFRHDLITEIKLGSVGSGSD